MWRSSGPLSMPVISLSPMRAVPDGVADRRGGGWRPLIVDEGLLERGPAGCGVEREADLLCGGGQTFDGVTGARLGAKRCGFRSGLHDELIVVDGEPARQGHHAGPAGGSVLGLRARVGDPSPEDAVALRIELRFGRVVGAVVEQTFGFGVEEHGRRIQRADLPKGAALRGVDEDVFAVEREEVGALPHFAAVDRVSALLAIRLALRHGVQVLPVAKVGGAIEKDAAARTALAGGNDEIPIITLPPRRRITKADDLHAGRRRGDDGLRLLAPVERVRRPRPPPCRRIRAAAGWRRPAWRDRAWS